MTNKKNKYPVPKFRNLEEEDRYWQSHSPLMEGYEGKVQRKKQNRASSISVRLTGEELARLREIATQYGLGPSTYVRQVLIQGMESGGARSLPPPLLMSLCNVLHRSVGEPNEEYLQQLNITYRQFLEMQDNMADQLARLCVPPLLQEALQKHMTKSSANK